MMAQSSGPNCVLDPLRRMIILATVGTTMARITMIMPAKIPGCFDSSGGFFGLWMENVNPRLGSTLPRPYMRSMPRTILRSSSVAGGSPTNAELTISRFDELGLVVKGGKEKKRRKCWTWWYNIQYARQVPVATIVSSSYTGPCSFFLSRRHGPASMVRFPCSCITTDLVLVSS